MVYRADRMEASLGTANAGSGNVNRRQEQIDFQAPWGVAGSNTAMVTVLDGNLHSTPRGYTVYGAAPGRFTLDGASAIVVPGSPNQLVTAANRAHWLACMVKVRHTRSGVESAGRVFRPYGLRTPGLSGNPPNLERVGRDGGVPI
jgi:hypothetical protein